MQSHRLQPAKRLHVKTLSQLKPGESAVVDSFTDDDISLKLMELGCLPGTEVRMGRCAPLGDPLAILIAGACLTLRKAEAATVVIQSLLSPSGISL